MSVSWQKRGDTNPSVSQGNMKEACGSCGFSSTHNGANCPAKDSKCHKCQMLRRYSAVCISTSICRIVTDVGNGSVQGSLFLGTLSTNDNSKAWMVTLAVEGQPFALKIETGADVSVMPLRMYQAYCWEDAERPGQTLSV